MITFENRDHRGGPKVLLQESSFKLVCFCGVLWLHWCDPRGSL